MRSSQEDALSEEGDELITIATFENEVEAAIGAGALKTAGIPAFVRGDNIGVFAVNRSIPLGTHAELKVRVSDRDSGVEALKRAGHR